MNEEIMKSAKLIFACLLVFAMVSCAEPDAAVEIIAGSIQPNELGVSASELLSKDNPNGEGRFVFVKRTRFNGVKRNLIWVIIDGNGYALNGPSKGVTPSLSWPREAPESTWDKTGLDPYSATEAIELVFGQY